MIKHYCQIQEMATILLVQTNKINCYAFIIEVFGMVVLEFVQY